MLIITYVISNSYAETAAPELCKDGSLKEQLIFIADVKLHNCIPIPSNIEHNKSTYFVRTQATGSLQDFLC